MAYEAETIDILKRTGRFEARISGDLGTVKDLQRNEVIVHTGKPFGSVSGWAGPVFWQVWVDAGQAAGHVFSRINREERQEWKFNPALAPEALLEAARDRAIGEAQAHRKALLSEATHQVEQLETAADKAGELETAAE